jgi:hypothetical protein
MEPREASLYFGDDREFRLSIHVDVQGHRHLALFHEKIRVDLGGPSLALLQFFLEHPNEDHFKTDIQDALALKDFLKTISLLRIALDLHAPNRVFIGSGATTGCLLFLGDVFREGDLGAEVFPRWRGPILDKLLREAELGSDEDSERYGDIRISTIAFSCGIPELGLGQLIKKGLKIRIIMLDPKEEGLLESRHGLRKDGMTPTKGKAEINGQIEALRKVVANLPKNVRGNIELRLTKKMPSAFVAHTRKRAVAGLFLSHASYSDGPMIVALSGTEPWHELYQDWIARWDDVTIKREDLACPKD